MQFKWYDYRGKLTPIRTKAVWCLVEYTRMETPATIDHLLGQIKDITGHNRWIHIPLEATRILKFKRVV